MTTKTQQRTVFLARMPFAGYELTAIASTADKARENAEQTAFASINAADEGGPWDPRPDDSETLFEYLGGNVTEMIVDGKVEWL